MKLRRRRRIGFTLVELLITVTIVGLLARIAIPRVNQIRLRARASSVVTDMEVLRTAAFHVLADSGVWPENAGVGTMPAIMASYLPPSFSFSPQPGVQYDWRLTGMPGGDPNGAGDGTTMGMGAKVDDAELRVELERHLAGQVTMVSGTTVYWLIWGPTIRP